MQSRWRRSPNADARTRPFLSSREPLTTTPLWQDYVRIRARRWLISRQMLRNRETARPLHRGRPRQPTAAISNACAHCSTPLRLCFGGQSTTSETECQIPAHGFAGRNVQAVAEHSVARLRFHNLDSDPDQGPRGTCGPTCSLRHRRSLWPSHYSLSSAQRRRNERPRASRRTCGPYERLGSPDCGSNAHAAAGCTKSPCVMRISMLPLMIVIDGAGPPNQKP